MLKYFLLLFIGVFFSVSANCSEEANLQKQKASIQHLLATASGGAKVELLLKLSLLCFDSVNKATILTRGALTEATRINNQYWIAKSYTNLATISLQNGSVDDSVVKYLAFAEKAFLLAGKKQFDPDYYLALAKYFFAINDFSQATAFCQIAAEISKAKNNGLILAKAYVMLAKISQKSGELNEFVEYLRMAEKEFLLCNDKATSGRSLIAVGLLYNDAGMNDLAQKVLVKATRLCEKYCDSLFLGYLYCNIAGVYQGSSQKGQTLLTLEKAVAIFKELKNDKGSGYAQNMLGSYYLDQKQYNQALLWFTKALKSNINISNNQGACFVACNLADVNMTLKKVEPVILSLAEAQKYAQSAGDPLSAIVFHSTKARFQVLNKEFTEGLINLNISLKLSRETGNNIFYLETLKTMADVYNLIGDETKALLYFRKYVEAGDSVRNAVKPLHQQELLSELNSEQLINMAVEEKKKSVISPTRFLPIVATILGVILLFGLSTKVFSSRNSSLVNNSGNIDDSSFSEGNGTSIEKTNKILITEEKMQILWARLRFKMEEEKYFLRSDISLHELAESLETNTSYLSKAINEVTGQNFNSFVNQYRIEEACKQLVNPKQQYLSIEGIAISVGFNSKSAFNAAFKKIKGLTPTDFIEQQVPVIQ